MAKSQKDQGKNAPPKKRQRDPIGGTADHLRGKTYDEILSTRRKLKKEYLPSLSKEERQRVMTHFHSGAEDLSRQRTAILRADDKNMDTSNLTPIQRRALHKRREKPNMALKRQMHRRETQRLENAVAAADAEEILHVHTAGFVEAENDMEKTTQLTQNQLKNQHLEEKTARNIFDLQLDKYGPYKVKYDRSGKFAALTGSRGHISIIDQHSLALKTEFFVNEAVKDATFLHNGTMLGVAQQQNVFIYDDDGVEIHRLSHHSRVYALDFLPYHWLLATVGHSGLLQYQDTSTGTLISQHGTKLGPCHILRQNPFNAVLHLGHTNGTVTLWSPSSSEYLVKMLCHKGAPVTSLAIDRSGRYMATGGGDSKVKIWDLRTFKELHSYRTYGGVASSIDISQTGVLGIAHGCHTTFYKPESLKIFTPHPYMKHQLSGKAPIDSLRFRPFEDVCGIGHARGMSSIVIPGSGEPNLDSMEHNTNPYQDTKQRREAEVRSLLEKLSPDMIALDPDSIGGIEESNVMQRLQRQRDLAEEADARKKLEDEKPRKEKNRMRGKNKIAKKLRRKQKNIVDENTAKLKEMLEKEKAEKKMEKESQNEEDDTPIALKRFF